MPRRKKEEVVSDDDDDFSNDSSRKFHKPIQRNAANARERARMRVLSKAFVKLKTTLPWVPADTKLSKLDTLRLASSYIAHLRQVLTNDDEDTTQPPFMHPMNLVSLYLVFVNNLIIMKSYYTQDTLFTNDKNMFNQKYDNIVVLSHFGKEIQDDLKEGGCGETFP